MPYIAVVNFDQETHVCRCAVVSDDLQNVTPGGDMRIEALGQYVLSTGMHPLNFTVDKVTRAIVQSMGSFKRFSTAGSAVVVAELKSHLGRTLGYRLLSCGNLQLVNLKTMDIVVRERAQGVPFLQNGIVRNDTVCCYPHSAYRVLKVNTGTKPKPRNLEENKVPAKPLRESEPAKTEVSRELSKPQRGELARCLAAGVNCKLIKNPDLKPEQMRVLWVSKSKGALAEYYSSPDFSVDAMKFYADRLYSKKIAAECKGMLEHPELSVDQLTELYRCVCDGVDYSDLLDKSAVNINIEREARSRGYWGDSSLFDDSDYYIKATNAAMKMMGV